MNNLQAMAIMIDMANNKIDGTIVNDIGIAFGTRRKPSKTHSFLRWTRHT